MIAEIWSILCQLSPWLLLGMLLSGLLHVLLPSDFISRRFQGTFGVLQAVAIGIPLPLCSCGVVPTGVGLKNQGAGNGPAMGFLISTPQTGIDSVLVSVSFFGWPFAIFKMLAALIMGLVGGVIANSNAFVDSKQRGDFKVHSHTHSHAGQGIAVRFTLHCFEIFRSFWFWLCVGILVSAAINVAVPESWMQSVGSLGLMNSMLLVLLISMPLYVCATASVPMAAALVSGGFPPAAALVFLMAGPATNTTTIGAIYGRFGIRLLMVYLVVIATGSFACGILFHWLLNPTVVEGNIHSHHHGGWFETLASVLVLVLVAICAVQSLAKRIGAANRADELSGHGTVLNVQGMTCPQCVVRLKGVLDVNFEGFEIDLHNQRVIFESKLKQNELLEVESAIAECGLSLSNDCC